MESDLTNAVGILTVVMTVVAAVLGYASERSLLGVAVLGGFSFVAGMLCFVAVLLGGWIGLVVAIALVTLAARRVGHGFGKERGATFVPGLWLGYCASCAIGYWSGGLLGLLTITLPALLVFWLGLFTISRYLLPLDGRNDWGKAFRTLLAYSLGTNYPYHVLEGRGLKQRVSGNPYGQFFAGPGIILTDPAHAPVIWEGTRFKRVGQPGLVFTERFETVYQLVDLRPQLRSFMVEAITKDGIRVRILTFLPFQLDAGQRRPALGTSFPYRTRSILLAMSNQLVQDSRKLRWDEVVPVIATRTMRRIISEYRFDDLCEPLDRSGDLLHPDNDPRIEIRTRLLEQVRAELEKIGIRLIGGGISNIEPVEKPVSKARTEAWRTEWRRKILVSMGEVEANAIWEVERAHVQAQAELISAVRRIVQHRPGINADVLTNMAALRFIEALEEVACRPEVRESLPDDTGHALAYLRKSLSQERT